MSQQTDYLNQLRDKTKDELGQLVQELEQLIEKTRLDQGFAKPDSVSEIGKMKKKLARAKTVLNETKS